MSTGSVTHARQNLSEIIDRVGSTGEDWVITKHGRPVAVILGHDEYESLVESLNILSDPETMEAIHEAEAELADDAPEGGDDASSD